MNQNHLQAAQTNPYMSSAKYSAYCKWHQDSLTGVFNEKAADMRAVHIHHVFRALIESPSFPCYGAKAALNKNTYRFALYGAMDKAETIDGLCHDLFAFSREQKSIPGNFTTFITCFDHTMFSNGQDFEQGVWSLLSKLCGIDSAHHAWDPMASADPEQPDFSFSFAGTSYFVAALSPVSPRMSRQFMIPALIFNAHYQFAAMRAKGTFNALRDRIRDKDTALENGIRNPLAAGFGEGAGGTVQYCGIPPAPGTQWKCPFHRNPKPEIK